MYHLTHCVFEKKKKENLLKDLRTNSFLYNLLDTSYFILILQELI